MDVPLSWRTDLAVLVASGSSVEEHADHLVVRTPSDPSYAWGNFVMVTDPTSVDEAARWESVFTSGLPDAAHRAIGLPVEPTDVAAWTALGLAIEHEDVLVRDALWSRDRWPRGTSSGRCRATTTGRSPPRSGAAPGAGSSTPATRSSSAPSPVTSWLPTWASSTAGQGWRATRT